jgi:hypothetical protein
MTTLKKWLKEWGLQGAKKQAHTFSTISAQLNTFVNNIQLLVHELCVIF